ncbi:MAG: tripartite tricarboxylate transporter substrate-binding protein, partial [Sideroxyarcus sp.]|nr:tripartite tricarboxylate transporter substrate-binding protein [Sideroxyarcus sp.]
MKKWIYLLSSIFFASAAWAQAAKFPEHPIRFIVPFAPGGGVDTVARLLAKQLGQNLAVPVIVENRAGGNGTVGGLAVKTAMPDGYTLLYSAATH